MAQIQVNLEGTSVAVENRRVPLETLQLDAANQTLWVPAVNNHVDFGRWAFHEIRDPRDEQMQFGHSQRISKPPK
jgi:hypothetical protein